MEKVESGLVSYDAAHTFDICLTSDGTVVVPHNQVAGVRRPGIRERTKYTARVALLTKNGKLEYFDILHAVEREKSCNLACSPSLTGGTRQRRFCLAQFARET